MKKEKVNYNTNIYTFELPPTYSLDIPVGKHLNVRFVLLFKRNFQEKLILQKIRDSGWRNCWYFTFRILSAKIGDEYIVRPLTPITPHNTPGRVDLLMKVCSYILITSQKHLKWTKTWSFCRLIHREKCHISLTR